ncbi:MAG: 4Fe-4S ferredoxin, partial [Aurantimonas coralicida]
MTDTPAHTGPRDTAEAALAALPRAQPPILSLVSDGTILICGDGAAAIDAGLRLAASLDVTVLLDDGGLTPVPDGLPFPVARGRIASATGHFGAYQAVVDGYMPPDG